MGAGSWRQKVGGGGHIGDGGGDHGGGYGGECDHFRDTMFVFKEVEIKSRARVFVELRGEARVKAVYLLF